MTGTLEQRPFGRTGETVSVIGLGGAALYKHSYELGVATVKHALDLGISYFDTSPLYGIGGADGRWISQGESQPRRQVRYRPIFIRPLKVLHEVSRVRGRL